MGKFRVTCLNTLDNITQKESASPKVDELGDHCFSLVQL
jgi:hypothetical protein